MSSNVTNNYIQTQGIVQGNSFVSTVTTGTQPLKITSQTLVQNLNVEKLGGQIGSYYTNATNIQSGILGVGYGGTGVTSLTSGYVNFGSSTGILGQSQNLFWDQTNNRLGIGTNTPSQSLNVIGNIQSSSNVSVANQLISSVATGTSPLNIISQTLVSNLNVEKLGGQIGSYYTNATNISTGLLAVSYGGTGISTFTSGYIHFGSSTGIMGQSSNLFWDQTNSRLGIGTNTPTQSLNVIGNIQSSSDITAANQLISSVATGTSPLNITSQTLVQNLNVEKLGGQVGSYYTNATNISNGLLAVSYGGTGISTFTSGYIHFGSSTGIMGQNSNLFWDQTNNRLGIKKTTPQYTIDIDGSVNVSSNFYINGSQFQSLALTQGYIPFGTGTSYSSTSNLFWDSTNFRLGIGTVSPSYSLHVMGNLFVSSNILASNRIGIGYTAPIAPLQVLNVSGQPDTIGISSTSSNSNIPPVIALRQYQSSTNIIDTKLGYLSWDWANYAGFSIGQSTNSSTNISNLTLDIRNGWDFGGTQIMSFKYGNNCVGILNNNPSVPLDVNGIIRSSSSIICSTLQAYSSTSVSIQGAYLHWNKDGGGGGTYLMNQKGGGGGGINFGEIDTANNFTSGMVLANKSLSVGNIVKQNLYYFRTGDIQNTSFSNNTLINFSTQVVTQQNVNISSCFQNNYSQFYPPVSGIWTFTFSFWPTLNSNLEIYMMCNATVPSTSVTSPYQSASNYLTQEFAASSSTPYSVTTTTFLNTTDYISIVINNNAAQSQTYNTNAFSKPRTFIRGLLLVPSI